MTAQQNTLSGTWYCWLWYPSKDDSGEDMTMNRMQAHQKGHHLMLQSEPNDEGSYLFVRLTIDGDVATGTWHESTSPDGNFEGALYGGAGQLVIAEDHDSMEGQWAGIGLDRTTQKKRVYTGRWKLSRQN